MIKKESRNISRKRRHRRIRHRIFGVQERPRLNVFRSTKHIYAQIIDDREGRTLASASTLEPQLQEELADAGNLEAAKKVGELIARRALDRGIKEVVFDRGGYLYHGRVKALAEAAREQGLKF
ncbi:MAG TPA: 50S ribosomal protein L18 [Firmicutes bacterium]|nr:50S ribosomal protein L18 [Bacillota bacterium]